jgi:hypothetical protein
MQISVFALVNEPRLSIEFAEQNFPSSQTVCAPKLLASEMPPLGAYIE